MGACLATGPKRIRHVECDLARLRCDFDRFQEVTMFERDAQSMSSDGGGRNVIDDLRKEVDELRCSMPPPCAVDSALAESLGRALIDAIQAVAIADSRVGARPKAGTLSLIRKGAVIETPENQVEGRITRLTPGSKLKDGSLPLPVRTPPSVRRPRVHISIRSTAREGRQP
ncbi:unnamed protein product (mitochondrion) [Plasmodiophora brassicae]|uniref:Uncharacterized protein n=1 Tax=Plasmodiophora brassicae TaxID=37360 RepID=A0A0G4INJ3_PLABS|nr:hypothetical protein PBRA_005353 [Plasmodiophora brassicae]SPR00714.1 unnamed protein product [Plasmodiophora brassicae]